MPKQKRKTRNENTNTNNVTHNNESSIMLLMAKEKIVALEQLLREKEKLIALMDDNCKRTKKKMKQYCCTDRSCTTRKRKHDH